MVLGVVGEGPTRLRLWPAAPDGCDVGENMDGAASDGLPSGARASRPWFDRAYVDQAQRPGSDARHRRPDLGWSPGPAGLVVQPVIRQITLLGSPLSSLVMRRAAVRHGRV